MSSILLPGVDKIWLSTQEFSVKDGNALGFNKRTKQGQSEENLPVLFTDKNGQTFKGTQSEYFGQTLPFYLGINQKGLSLQFNPSKILHSYNLVSDVSEIQKIEKQISYELNDVGICFNSLDARPTRLDLAKQDFLSRSIDNYYPVFNYLEGKRMKGRPYETGFTFDNTLHEFCFYSKGHECKNEKLINMMRAENRLKKPDPIRKALGFYKFSDFLKSDAIDWNTHYVNYLNSNIFRSVKQGQLFDFDNEVEKLKMFKCKGRNAFNNYLITTSLENILQSFGNLKFLWKIMSEAGFSRQQIHKEKVKIRELMKFTGKNKILSISTLIEELKEKFAA